MGAAGAYHKGASPNQNNVNLTIDSTIYDLTFRGGGGTGLAT